MRVLALYNIKGGVGKTASAVNLAWLAARDGARVLLWDLDPQGAASFYFRVRPRRGRVGKRLLKGEQELEAAIRGSDYEGLDVLPADLSNRKLERALEKAERPDHGLQQALAPLAREYDLILLDCAPSLGRTSENVFTAADALLVPTIPTTLSLRTLAQLMGHLKHRSGRRPRVLPFFCLVDRRKALHRDVCDWVRRQGLGFLAAAIPYASDVEKMGVRRRPVFVDAPRCAAARAYEELWSEVQRRLARAEQGAPPLFAKGRRELLERYGSGRLDPDPEDDAGTVEAEEGEEPVETEIEFKFRVEGERDFERLRSALGRVEKRGPVRQVNHLFGDRDGALGAAGIAVRLREESGRATLTVKGPQTAQGRNGTLAARAEEETEVGAQRARAILAGTERPLAVLRERLGGRSSALLDRAESLLGGHELVHLGSFENDRESLGPVAHQLGGRRCELSWELDRTRFPGAVTHYEIEVEVPSLADADRMRHDLCALLERNGIHWSPSTSKVRRFLELLENGR